MAIASRILMRRPEPRRIGLMKTVACFRYGRRSSTSLINSIAGYFIAACFISLPMPRPTNWQVRLGCRFARRGQMERINQRAASRLDLSEKYPHIRSCE